MRETEQCERKKEKKRKKKEKMSFQLVVRYGEMLFVKSRFLACSPRYHPGGVYFGWVEMWEVDGAIELTMVNEFI